jgi:hypothetical protein
LYPKEDVTLQLHVNEELIETLPKPFINNEQPPQSETTESFSQGMVSIFVILVFLLTDSFQNLIPSSLENVS